MMDSGRVERSIAAPEASAAGDLARRHLARGDFCAAEEVIRRALASGRADFDLLNLLGAALHKQKRSAEALAALNEAHALNPTSSLALLNRGTVLLSLGDWSQAVSALKEAVRRNPNDVLAQRQFGVALSRSGNLDKAWRRFMIVRALAPHDIGALIELSWIEEQRGRPAEAMALVDRGLIEEGFVPDLVRARTVLLRRHGKHRQAAAWLGRTLQRLPFDAMMSRELALTFAAFDRDQANRVFAAALEKAPDDLELLIEYAESLQRTRGPDEAANIDNAYTLARRALALSPDTQATEQRLRSVLVRCADFCSLQQSFRDQGEALARKGGHTQLLPLLAQIGGDEDRRLLLDWHRRCAAEIETLAARSPISRPAIGRKSKLRIGILSADIRNHPVGYFLWPLVGYLDRDRVEVYCYATNRGSPDQVERAIAQRATAFRNIASGSLRDGAQAIASDVIDVLIEIGGPTDSNRPGILSWRPARRQASWMGYPHSTGFSAVDRIILDPYIAPPDTTLLVEKPLLLPKTFAALHQPGFAPSPDIDPVPPVERKGYVTFGTMNNPYKYTRSLIETWAEVVARVPNSRFLFVRPEAGVAAFKSNIIRLFGRSNVSPDRLEFTSVRGSHLQHYNDIDVALDTFPQTGGTTTIEAHWMGVPTITYVGEAVFERISHTINVNLGLSELGAASRDEFVNKAVKAAHDVEWRRVLRRTARTRFTEHPLGRPDLFAKELVAELCAWMDGTP